MSNWREEKIWRFRSRSMAAGERFKRDQSIAVRGQRGGFGFTHSAGECRRSSLRYDSLPQGVSRRGAAGLQPPNGEDRPKRGTCYNHTPSGGRVPSSRHLCCQRPATRYPFGSPTNVILKPSPSLPFHNHGARNPNEAMPHGHAPNSNAPLMPTTPPPS